MTDARAFAVTGLRRDPEIADATDVWKDFELKDDGRASIAELNDPSINLYSIDLQHNAAVFVDAGELGTLAHEPFFYMAQRRRARRVYSLDLDAFFRMSLDTTIPPGRLIHLYSVGRCGSTLLHHAFNQVDGVMSLSEPDVFFQIALWIKTRKVAVEYAGRLAAAALRYFWRRRPPGVESLVLKHRGRGIWAFHEFREAARGARAVFLYRNAADTIQSFDHAANYPHGRREWLLNVPIASAIVRAGVRLAARKHGIDLFREHLRAGTPMDIVSRSGPAGFQLLEWISKMDCYLQLRELDHDAVAVRYEDLVAQPSATLNSLLTSLGLGTAGLERVITVFAADSQEGTALQRTRSRAYPLSEKTLANISRVLRSQTRLPPDAVLPGTLTPTPPAGSSTRGTLAPGVG